MSGSSSNGAANAVMAATDQLPLVPHITPALSVASVLLMLTGLMYCFIGIKRSWIQVSISSAYLVALAITVLIIYVVDPPVSLALQGAYLVAIAGPALVLAPLAYIFKDVTEGFGCAVGGFAISMFLLVLRPGGLLPTTEQKAIFIGCWTLGIYLLSLSRYTRTYALIASSAIGGATTVVLGIDCFSLAGLKEFWVYLWGLNSTIFPASTHTYPMTRGMRVEIAAIVVLSFFGILSQVRIWKVVQRQKEKQEKAQRDVEAQRDDAEAEIGRQVQATAAEARERWEASYGDSTKTSSEAKVEEVHLESDHGTEEISTRKNSSIEDFRTGESIQVLTVQTTLLEDVVESPVDTTLTEQAELAAEAKTEPASVDAKWPFSSIDSIDGTPRLSQDGTRRQSTTSRKSMTRPNSIPEQIPLVETHSEVELTTISDIKKSPEVVEQRFPALAAYDIPDITIVPRSKRRSTQTITSIEALADPSFYDDCFSMGGLDCLDDPKKDDSVKSNTADLDDSDTSLPAETALTEESETPASTVPEHEKDGGVPLETLVKPGDAESGKSNSEQAAPLLQSKASLQSLREELAIESNPIVQRFRTKEWAKHLSLADLPEPDPIRPVESSETPSPLDTAALVQTPLTAEPEPQFPPLPSSVSSSNSIPVQYTPGGRPIPTFHHSHGPPPRLPSDRASNEVDSRVQNMRRASAPNLPRQPTRRATMGLRNGMSPVLSSPISEDEEMSFHTPLSSPRPADTLIAQRNKRLQHRDLTGQSRRGSYPYPNPTSSTSSLRQSSTHSVYSNPTSASDALLLEETQTLSARRQQLKQAQSSNNIPTAPSRAPPRSLTYPPQPELLTPHTSPIPTPPTNRHTIDQSLRRRTMLAHWHSSLRFAEAQQQQHASPWTVTVGGRALAPTAPTSPATFPPANTAAAPAVRHSRPSSVQIDRPAPSPSIPTQPWRDRRTKHGMQGWGTPGEAKSLAGLGGAQQLNSAHREVLRRMQAGANRRLRMEDA